MVKLIYGVPENQPWYTLDDGVLVSQTDNGWELKTIRGEVMQIGQIIYQQMRAKLSPEDRLHNDAYMTIATYIRNGQRTYGRITRSTSLVYV